MNEKKVLINEQQIGDTNPLFEIARTLHSTWLQPYHNLWTVHSPTHGTTKGQNTHLLQYCCHNAGINHRDFKFSVL